jgi:hypothetical protein
MEDGKAHVIPASATRTWQRQTRVHTHTATPPSTGSRPSLGTMANSVELEEGRFAKNIFMG